MSEVYEFYFYAPGYGVYSVELTIEVARFYVPSEIANGARFLYRLG